MLGPTARNEKGNSTMSDVLRWTLLDVSSRIWKETFELTSDHVRGQAKGAPWSIRKRTLRGGLADGVDLVEVDNGALSFTVLPSRGMGLWCGSYNGHSVGWRSPVSGPVNPRFVNLLDQGGLGWLKGFDEWVVRCGLDSNGPPCTDIVPDNNGNPSEVQLTLHGRIANLPACKLEVQVVRGEQTELVVQTGTHAIVSRAKLSPTLFRP